MGNKNLYKVSEMVWFCLEQYPETRNNDRELIYRVYNDFYGVFSEPFFRVLDRTDLPSFESIRRARQKIQQENEDMRPLPEVDKARIAKQEDYIAFARGEAI